MTRFPRRFAVPLVAAALVAAVAACARDNPAAPPPPPAPLPPVTRVEVKADTVLLFTGSKTPAKAFVVTAYDSTGAVVADPVLSIAVPYGWTVRGDTIVAPAFESVGKIKVSARRRTSLDPAASLALDRVPGVPLYAAAGTTTAPAATDSVTATAAIDLRAYTWGIQWGCTGGNIMIDGVTGQIDSLTYDGQVVRVDYPSDTATWVRDYDGVAQLHWRGTRSAFQHDSLVKVDTVEFTPASVFRQAPDTLVFSSPLWSVNPATGTGQYPAPRVSPDTVKRVYQGAGWCGTGTGGAPIRPTVITAL